MTITVTPQDYAARWSTGLQGASTKITQGVNAVSVAPSAKAIAAQAKMVQNFNASVTNGKWAKNTGKVTLQMWKDAMVNKGIQRIGQGAIDAQPKMVAFATQLLPFEQTLQNQVQAMPSLTLQNNIDRATAWIRGMATFTMK